MPPPKRKRQCGNFVLISEQRTGKVIEISATQDADAGIEEKQLYSQQYRGILEFRRQGIKRLKKDVMS